MSRWDTVVDIRDNITGGQIVEQLNQDDADESNILTFSANINAVEIYHNESSMQTFIVNGISLDIAGGGWRSRVGGTPSNEVTIPAGINCTVARLI